VAEFFEFSGVTLLNQCQEAVGRPKRIRTYDNRGTQYTDVTCRANCPVEKLADLFNIETATSSSRIRAIQSLFDERAYKGKSASGEIELDEMSDEDEVNEDDQSVGPEVGDHDADSDKVPVLPEKEEELNLDELGLDDDFEEPENPPVVTVPPHLQVQDAPVRGVDELEEDEAFDQPSVPEITFTLRPVAPQPKQEWWWTRIYYDWWGKPAMADAHTLLTAGRQEDFWKEHKRLREFDVSGALDEKPARQALQLYLQEMLEFYMREERDPAENPHQLRQASLIREAERLGLQEEELSALATWGDNRKVYENELFQGLDAIMAESEDKRAVLERLLGRLDKELDSNQIGRIVSILDDKEAMDGLKGLLADLMKLRHWLSVIGSGETEKQRAKLAKVSGFVTRLVDREIKHFG